MQQTKDKSKTQQRQKRELKKKRKRGNSLTKFHDARRGKKKLSFQAELDKLLDEAIEHMNDDFNTPRCIASLFDLSKKINSYSDKKLDINDLNSQSFNRLKETYLKLVFEVLGLKDETDGGGDNQEMVNGLMDLILEIRKSSREKKDWDTSDQIRNVLKTLDIAVKDGADGSKGSGGLVCCEQCMIL